MGSLQGSAYYTAGNGAFSSLAYDLGNGNEGTDEPKDCWHSEQCRQEWANNVGAFATLLDTGAAGLNGIYALVGDIVIAVCAVCEVGVLGIYRFYSFIPNSISTLAMLFWIGQGVLTGENNFTITPTSQGTTVSLSVSQDTIVAVGTNIVGWLIPEPNIAFGLDTIVAGYDYGRSGVISFLPTIPTWINPTITYNTNSGFDFSWHQ